MKVVFSHQLPRIRFASLLLDSPFYSVPGLGTIMRSEDLVIVPIVVNALVGAAFVLGGSMAFASVRTPFSPLQALFLTLILTLFIRRVVLSR